MDEQDRGGKDRYDDEGRQGPDHRPHPPRCQRGQRQRERGEDQDVGGAGHQHHEWHADGRQQEQHRGDGLLPEPLLPAPHHEVHCEPNPDEGPAGEHPHQQRVRSEPALRRPLHRHGPELHQPRHGGGERRPPRQTPDAPQDPLPAQGPCPHRDGAEGRDDGQAPQPRPDRRRVVHCHPPPQLEEVEVAAGRQRGGLPVEGPGPREAEDLVAVVLEGRVVDVARGVGGVVVVVGLPDRRDVEHREALGDERRHVSGVGHARVQRG